MKNDLKKILATFLLLSLLGCASAPNQALPNDQKAALVYQTAIDKLFQDYQEKRLGSAHFHENWIGLLNNHPYSFPLKTPLLQANADLLRISNLIAVERLPAEAYREAWNSHFLHIRKLEANAQLANARQQATGSEIVIGLFQALGSIQQNPMIWPIRL